MGKIKKHEIGSLKDIVSAVNVDNLDNFLVDFRAFLSIVTMSKSIGEIVGQKDAIEVKKFVWIDDGKHNVKATFAPK